MKYQSMSSTKSKRYRVTGGVQVGQQLGHDEILRVIDHQVHDGFGHQISRRLGDDLHVRVDQVANCLHLHQSNPDNVVIEY